MNSGKCHWENCIHEKLVHSAVIMERIWPPVNRWI